jgi:hypothetical protein
MCPRCRSTEVGRSRCRKLLDPLLRWFGMKPYRCRDCRKRFYLPVTMERKHRHDRAWRRWVRADQGVSRRKREAIAPANPTT